MLTQDELDKRLFDRPESKIEREITPENAQRSIAAANTIKDVFCGSILPIEALGLITDGWSSFTMLHDDD